MERVAGDQPDRATRDARQRRDDAGAEAGTQLERRARVDERIDDRADVVAAQAVGRQQGSQRGGVGGFLRSEAPLEEREIAPGRDNRFGLVDDEDVDHAGAAWTSLGPICSGLKTPRPPPSTIAGPPMPIELSRVAMTT